MLKCEICYDWCRGLTITKQWWDIAKNDWNLLNGKDLPYYIAILAVLRETIKEIFFDRNYCKNHSELNPAEDKRGYALALIKECEFIPLTEQRKDELHGLYLTIKAFRNSSAHISEIKPMNPVSLTRTKNPEDSSQDYYRYAPFPSLYNEKQGNKIPFNNSDLRQMHQFLNQAILKEVRSPNSNIDSAQINYEFYHVERGPFIDLLHTQMIELLKEVKVW